MSAEAEQAVREAATICPRPCDLDLWPFDLESGVRVTCDVGYLCANFCLPRHLCSRLRPDLSDRQTSDRKTDVRCQTSDVKQHHRLMPPPRGREHNKTGGPAAEWMYFVSDRIVKCWGYRNLLLKTQPGVLL